MTQARASRKFRADYQPPSHLIDTVDLLVNIQDTYTDIRAVYAVKRNPDAVDSAEMRLDGRDMTLLSVAVDGRVLTVGDYELDERSLVLRELPDAFELTIENRIDPENNLSLEGFYRSGDILCTQCEATGFSRIMYFPDRPDVMARYTVLIEADKKANPVLLSNGNCMDSGDLADGRHYAVYHDPYVKPCYLFALVAGDLGMIRDNYTTGSGRTLDLRLYTEHGNESQCEHAMASLKQAMVWDEATYGLEYDLDSYVTVAVGSFNMGAMENKGLNVFNTACIFARPDTATDADFARVRDVVAHEYFHNYTGNRVTCRDWFQLSLKEGLTVFREHQFAIDHGSPGVTRIEQVRLIREGQFPEDAGPRAHPVRPDSYVEMNNFYTITVYFKGAEVIRMMAELAGRDAFIRAVQHYLKKHDGQAVTIEDFAVAIEESTGLDLGQFRRWYAQAGTPRIKVDTAYDAGRKTFELTLSQHTQATPGQREKEDFDIPVGLALFDQRGAMLGEPSVVRLQGDNQSWTFDNIDEQPTLSLLRGFTAPVAVEYQQADAELARLMAYDSDPVCRWDAAQQLYLNTLVSDVKARSNGEQSPVVSTELLDAVGALLDHPPEDRSLLAEMLTLPSEARIGEEFGTIDIHAIIAARDALKLHIAETFAEQLAALADAHAATDDYRFDVAEAGRRRVLGVALGLLSTLGEAHVGAKAQTLYDNADNMTDRMSALNALRDVPGERRDAVMTDFAGAWQAYPLVMDKWLRLQVSTRSKDAVKTVQSMLEDDRFDFTNPNRIRALLVGFARGNLAAFHGEDGCGYSLLGREIERVDSFNPQMAASLAGLLASWRRYVPTQGQLMHQELERLFERQLSDNTREIIETALADPE